MYDVASALIECRFDSDFETFQAAMLEGYRECRPLPQEDLDMLSDFKLIRGLAVIGWFYQRPEYAGSDYFERFRTWVLGECERRGY